MSFAPSLAILKRHLRPLMPLVLRSRVLACRLVRKAGGRIAPGAVDAGVSAGHDFRMVEPAVSVNAARPDHIESEGAWQFRGGASFTSASEGVFDLRDIRFWGHYGGVALDREFRLLMPFSHSPWGEAAHPARLRWRWPQPVRLDGVTAVLCTPEADDNFWHWTTELLPRLHLLRKAGWPDDRVDRYLVNGPRGGFRSETLRDLGVPDAKVLHVDASQDLHLERALFTTRREQHHELPPWVHRFLRENQPKAVWPGGRRLYLSRQGCAFRRAIDPGPMEALLRERGFEEFRPEAHPVAVQRGAFAAAEAVVGIHGSGFTNVIHCAPGARVIEIFPPLYHDLAFFVASRLSGLRYGLVNGRGELPPDGVNPRARFADVDVDVDALRRALEAFGL